MSDETTRTETPTETPEHPAEGEATAVAAEATATAEAPADESADAEQADAEGEGEHSDAEGEHSDAEGEHSDAEQTDAEGEHAAGDAEGEHAADDAEGEHAAGEGVRAGKKRDKRRKKKAKEDEPALSPEERKRQVQETRFLGAIGFNRAVEGLKQHCRSALGRQVLGRLKLLYDAEKVKTCLDQTREMMDLVKAKGPLPFEDLRDPSAILARIEDGQPLESRDLRQVFEALDAAAVLKTSLEGLPEESKLRSLASHLDPVAALRDPLGQAIGDRGGMLDQASERLTGIRQRVRTLRREIEDALVELTKQSDVGLALHSLRPVIRNNRMVLAFKGGREGVVPGEIVSKTKAKGGGIVYLLPEAVKGKSDELVDLQQEERAEVKRVLGELTALAKAHEAVIERTASTLGWLDFTAAKAGWALAEGFHVPQVSHDGGLLLKDARHPLLGQEKDKQVEAVPFTLTLGGQQNVLVVSGPKQGGKTVVLRTVGLCAAMAQSGLPIPAGPSSALPVYTHLFADISEGRGGPASRSAFTTHLIRVREVLEEADGNSLVLVDELGSHTDPQEGAALGAAFLDQLLARGAHAVVSTHLRQIKQFVMQAANIENACLAYDGDKHTPTYRLVVGSPGTSYTLETAQRTGLPVALLDKAKELLGQEDRGLDELIKSLQGIAEQAKSDAAAAEKDRQAMAEERKAIEAERAGIDRKKHALSMESDLELDEQFLKLQKTIRETTDALKGMGGEVAEKLEEMQQKVNALLKHTPFEQKREDFAKNLKKGDYVYVVSIDQVGEVVKLQRDKRKLKVACGALVFETGFDNVSWVQTQAANAEKRRQIARGEDVETKPGHDEYGFRKGQRPVNYQGGGGRRDREGGEGGGRGRGRGDGQGGGGRGQGGGGGRGPGGGSRGQGSTGGGGHW